MRTEASCWMDVAVAGRLVENDRQEAKGIPTLSPWRGDNLAVTLTMWRFGTASEHGQVASLEPK